jgi:hypothetical protein
MSALDHYAEHYRSAVQALVTDELIMSVGLFTRTELLAPGGGRTPWLANDVALAAGTARLVAVAYRPSGMEIDAVAVLASWPRERVTATLRETAVVRSLQIAASVDDGADHTSGLVELHSPRQLGAFDRLNDALYRDLGVRTLSTPPGS